MGRAWLWWLALALVVLVIILWVTIDTLHDGKLPTLPHLGEFLSTALLVVYGIDRASRRRR